MDRNKNLDIIDLLQDLKEKINLQEDVKQYLLVYPTERTRHGEKKWLVVHNIWPTMKHGEGQLIKKCDTKEEAVDAANKLKDDKTEVVISDVIETGYPETKIGVKESIEDFDYSSLSTKDLEDKLNGLQNKLRYFMNDKNKRFIRPYIEALKKELQKREASVEVKEAKKVAFEDTEIVTWFERDRQHVELRYKDAGGTIMEWWDEEVTEAVEDGFLDPKNWHQSAYDYVVSLGMISEATKVPQTMQPKEELEDNPETVGMKDGEAPDKSKDREDVIKEIPDKDLEKLPTQENKQLMLCNSCCKVFRANENKCIHCQSTLVEKISQDVSKKDEAIQKDSKIKEQEDLEDDTKKELEFDKEKKEHPSFTDDQIWQIVKDHMKENERKVKEAEDSDTLQIVSRGIVDKATADKLAAEQKGMVTVDDKDKTKFMVIRKGK